LIRAFLAKVAREEIIPIVPPVPDTDLNDYYKLVERRFANRKIGDTVRRLCLDGSNRQPKFIVPSIADRLKKGLAIDGLALESALWCRYCFGTTDSGQVIEPNDPNWDRLQAVAKIAKADPTAWLGMADIYGEVGTSPVMREAFTNALNALWAKGAERVVREHVRG
jgi:mannitol 2-dehydrogenase